MSTRRDLFEIIFGTSNKAGKRFDMILLWIILVSVTVVILDSVAAINAKFGTILLVLEWCFTVLFTIEYFVRVYAVPRRWKYIFSFWGIIDLIAFLPTYLSLIFVGYKYLIVLRIARLIRVFKVYSMTRFLLESKSLYAALRSSIYKISIFMLMILIIVVILGSVMYIVEGENNGFTSIPQSIYWAIITITTVGYGDIVPATVFGKFISSFIMLIGYSIIAVPTGIITMELTRSKNRFRNSHCQKCDHHNPKGALFCNSCGNPLGEQ